MQFNLKNSRYLISFKNTSSPLLIFMLASSAVFILFVWQGNKGFNMADEGFLWYGVQRVMLGDVPIRDFMAYDPGRYYWSAALMKLWGDNGIMALRTVIAIFQTFGLFVGLLLIARVKKQNYLYLFLSTIILLTWMFPRHKLFDISLSIFLLGILTFLIEKPTQKRYFLTGICIGFIACFGRNHGVYGLFGALGAMLWLNFKQKKGPNIIQGILFGGVGLIIGFSPILLFLAFEPGFFHAFWQSIIFLFELKGTNLPLPVPWPWKANFALPFLPMIQYILIGLFFIGVICFGVISIIGISWKKNYNKPVCLTLVASAVLALPYMHFAFSRAGIGHLAQGIFPALIGILVLLANQSAKVKWSFAFLLLTASCLATQNSHPGWQCFIQKDWVNVEISNKKLKIAPNIAKDITLIRDLTNRLIPNEGTFIAAPLWPGAYAILERQAPFWEIYGLFHRKSSFELAEIEKIKAAKPRFAFIIDIPLDSREELRFQHTHPLTHEYIKQNFNRDEKIIHPNYQVYVANIER